MRFPDRFSPRGLGMPPWMCGLSLASWMPGLLLLGIAIGHLAVAPAVATPPAAADAVAPAAATPASAAETDAPAAPSLPDRSGENNPVLAVVNGDSVRASDLDAAIVDLHQGMGAESRGRFDYRRLFEKLVNDRLILQEAEAIGMAQEAEFRQAMDERLGDAAARRFVETARRRTLVVTDAEVRQYFDDYYWRIRMRRISVPTREEALERIEQIRAGVDMDSLARAISLDPLKIRGGLTNILHWWDVEIPLREASTGVPVGGFSEPFPRNDAWSFLRVEERAPVDEAIFDEKAPGIRKGLEKEARDQVWEEWIDSLKTAVGVTFDESVLGAIRADSAVVLRGEFRNDSRRVAVRIGEAFEITESRLRQTTSQEAMKAGTDPFEAMLQRGIEAEVRRGVITEAARRSGFFEDPPVVERIERARDQQLIERYLGEMIAQKIVFNRQEFQEYYEAHKEDFRGPEEVLLATLIIDDEARANEASERLSAGADIEFLRKEYEGSGAEAIGSGGQPKWAPLFTFAEPVVRALESLKPGESTPPIAIGSNWAVFQLKGRRPGAIKEMSEVEMQIRQVMYQKKFNERLDEHLGALKEASEIVYFEPAIESYFENEESGS